MRSHLLGVGIIVAAFTCLISLGPSRAEAQVPAPAAPIGQARDALDALGRAQDTGIAAVTDEERAVLLEFFNATGGTRWKQADGWSTPSDPCEWHGVLCLPVVENGQPRWAPSTLNLPDNGLTGALPISLFRLSHLKSFILPGNRITTVPQEAFALADANRVELRLTGNPIPELLARVALRIDHYTGVCMPDQQLQFAAEFDGAARRVRYQGMFCPGQSVREGYCLSAESLSGRTWIWCPEDCAVSSGNATTSATNRLWARPITRNVSRRPSCGATGLLTRSGSQAVRPRSTSRSDSN